MGMPLDIPGIGCMVKALLLEKGEPVRPLTEVGPGSP